MANREEALKQLSSQKQKLKVAVDVLLRTEEGREFFKYLFRICGYNQSDTVVDPATHEFIVSATAYNNARRDVYIQLRSLASPVLLLPVEEAAEREMASSAEAPKEGEGKNG